MKFRTTSLVDVCNPKQWPTIPIKSLLPEGYPVYGANGRIGFYNKYTHTKKTILITCRGATCGTLNICEPFSYVTGNAMALDNLCDDVHKKYLYFFLRYRGFKDVISGSAQPQITRQGLSKVKIFFPPLDIQKRIATVLDKTDQLRQKRKQAIEKLDQLIQSVFLDMFGDPVTNPMDWKCSDIHTFVKGIQPGFSIGGEQRKKQNGELGVLKISAVTKGEFLPNEYKVVQKEMVNKEMIHPFKGDVLFSRANTRELVAATCIVDKDYPDLFLPDKLWKIELDKNTVLPYYFKNVLSNERYRSELTKKATGTSGSMLNISQEKLKRTTFPIPPIKLQKQFFNIMKIIETSKITMKQSACKMDEQFQSLLQRAFKGELKFNDKAFKELEQAMT